MLNQAPIFVKAIDAMPVLVWYNPVGIDVAGNLLFFEDVCVYIEVGLEVEVELEVEVDC